MRRRSTLTAEHAAVTKQLVEVQSVQKQIRDMELELARIKATYPPENVSRRLNDDVSY
jgi:hypothetical protein